MRKRYVSSRDEARVETPLLLRQYFTPLRAETS